MSATEETNGRDTRQPIVAANADLSGSTFDDVGLRAARFRNVDLSDAVIENANLAGLRVDNVNLSGASFADCTMTGMTIEGVLVTELFAAYRAVRAGG
jgi:uncharacterized protein YjbI with pentapeptide repeats